MAKNLPKNTFITAIVIILLSGILTQFSFSQTNTGTITGTVVDKSNNSPIEAADVTLHRVKDSSLVKGTSTDASGKFTLSDIPFGRYYVKANLVGYNFVVVSGISLSAENPNITLHPVKLSTGSTTTEEIVVEGEKGIIEFRPDKKIFNVAKNITAQGGTLLELLKEVPSVTVDQDGNVSLRGSEGVKILIDGRPSGLEGQGRNLILQQIPASDVESIELITNPSAKFEAEGSAGIINVILKKGKQQGFGYNGTVGLNVGTGDKYTGQFSLNMRNDKVNLYGNYSYNLLNSTSSGFSDRLYFNNSSIGEITQESSGRGRNKSHMFKVGLDYFPDRQNTLGLSFNFRTRNGSRGSTITNNEFDLSNNLVTDYYTTSNDFDKAYTFDINANYMLRFKNKDQVLSADVSYSNDKDDESENNYDTYISPVNNTPDKRNEYSNELKHGFTGKIDYVHPFSKDIRLETGYRGSYSDRDNDYKIDTFDYSQNQFVTDFNQTNRFIYKEQVHALYGLYIQQIGGFGFSLGGRVEQTYTNGELAATDQVSKRNYLDFFPSLSVSQKITPATEIQLSYSKRINRPRSRQLNPFRSFNGSNNYSQGNPLLNPEFTDAFELNFIQYFPWATITPGVFYRYTKDEITRTRTLIDSISTLTTFENINSSRSYGGELIVSSQPAKFLNFNGTFSYYKSEVDGTNLENGATNSTNSWSTRLLSTVTLPEDLSFQLSYFYTGKRLTPQGTISPFQSFDAAVKKDLFNKKLSITLRASDIFDTGKFSTQFDDVDFSEYSERVRDSRGLFLNLTYRFGEQEKKQPRERKRKDDDNNDDGGDFDY